MVRILAIGDPHGVVPKGIPKEDIDLVLLTGDLGKADLARKRSFENKAREQEGLPELEETKEYVKSVHNEIHYSTVNLLGALSKVAPVYSIQGNVGIPGRSHAREENEKHGLHLPSTYDAIKKMKHVYIVKNRLRVLDNLRLGFLEYFTDTSWIREFHPPKYAQKMKGAKKETDKARRVLDSFGRNLDILVCHQPPFGILDKVNFPGVPKNWKGKHAGSSAVLDYIKEYQPRHVLCGHIHEGAGERILGKTKIINLGMGKYTIIEM